MCKTVSQGFCWSLEERIKVDIESFFYGIRSGIYLHLMLWSKFELFVLVNTMEWGFSSLSTRQCFILHFQRRSWIRFIFHPAALNCCLIPASQEGNCLPRRDQALIVRDACDYWSLLCLQDTNIFMNCNVWVRACGSTVGSSVNFRVGPDSMSLVRSPPTARNHFNQGCAFNG